MSVAFVSSEKVVAITQSFSPMSFVTVVNVVYFVTIAVIVVFENKPLFTKL